MSNILDQIGGHDDVAKLPLEDLPRLAENIRDRIVEVMPVNGGHFGSGLGIADLTVALHRVFDFRHDHFVLDVSHQCYPHKMLTGRKDWYKDIRQKGGPAGYTRPEESEYDRFFWAHAGSSLSTALGLARGSRGDDSYTVAIIGDGSLPAGMAMEALNHWGVLDDERLIVVINDNEMSIAPAVGGLNNHLREIAADGAYADGSGENAHLGRFFEAYGHRYIGPVDGHDMSAMVELFAQLKQEGRGAIVHARTIKGKGHVEAEKDQWKWHAVGPAKGSVPDLVEHSRMGKSPFTNEFVDAVIERAKTDDSIHAITAAMPCGTGLRKFQAEFPDRFYDTGIAEQHAVGFAAGLAKAGKTPICAIYSTFLQRAFDQLFQEVSLNNLPVVLCMDRAGIVGPDGMTHNGCFDIAYTRALPRINIMAPADSSELKAMLDLSIDSKEACAIRYPRTAVAAADKELGSGETELAMGKASFMRRGDKAAIMAYGSMVYPAMDAADRLAAEGIEVSVVNARFVRPFDVATLAEVLDKHPVVFTVEEHNINGGFGSATLEAAATHRLDARRIVPIALPDGFVEHGSRAEMLHEHGLDPKSLAEKVKAGIAAEKDAEKSRNLREFEAF